MSAEEKPDIDYSNRYTLEEWELWEGDWELIRGFPWAMSPAPSRKHQKISGNLFAEFRERLTNCEYCRPELPINYRISEDTILQPDLLVVCGDADGGLFLDTRPQLVAEVLSPSTANKDLNLKTIIYADQDIPYYLIVHPDEEWMRVLVLENGEWQLKFEGKEGKFDFDFEGCKASIDLSKIWA